MEQQQQQQEAEQKKAQEAYQASLLEHMTPEQRAA